MVLRLQRLWTNLPILDLALGALGLLWMVGPVSKEVARMAEPVAAAAAAVLALFAAVITFACTSLYQSLASHVVDVRRRFGRQMRHTWISAIGTSCAAAVICLIAIVVGESLPRVSLTLTTGAVLAGLASTGRALWWLTFVLEKDDESLPGVDFRPSERRTAATEKGA